MFSLGLMFKISENTANNIFNYWQKSLEETLPTSLLEQVKKWKENEEGKVENKEILSERILVEHLIQNNQNIQNKSTKILWLVDHKLLERSITS